MGRPDRAAQRAYMQTYRSNPLTAAIHAWESRTRHAAMKELAKLHPGEYARLLYGIREQDPKPEAATKEGQDRAA